jgi:hypothetical protein
VKRKRIVKRTNRGKGALALLAAVAAVTTVGAGLPASAAEPSKQALQSGTPLTLNRGTQNVSTDAVADLDYLIFSYRQNLGPAPANKVVYQPFQASTATTIGGGSYYDVGRADSFAKGANLARDEVSKVDFSGYNLKGQAFSITQRNNPSSCLNHTDVYGGAISFGACAADSFWRISTGGLLVSSTNATFSASVFVDGGTGTTLAMTNSDDHRHPLLNFHAAAEANGVVKDVEVTSQSWKGDNLTLTGTSEPDTVVRHGGQQASVNSAGVWTMVIPDVPAATTSMTVVQLIAGDELRSTKITLEPRQAPLTASTAAGASNAEDVTISGGGTPDGAITIVNDAGKTVATTTVNGAGAYAATIAAPNSGGRQTFEVSQRIGGSDAGRVAVSFDYGSAVSVTSPTNNTVHPGGPVSFAGRGEAGGDVTIREEGKPGVLASGVVAANGSWAINGVDLDRAEHKLVISQLSRGNNTTAAKLTLSPGASNIVAPTVTSPAHGSTVDVSRPTFTGAGQPGARVTVGYGANSIIGTAGVNDKGEWTINPTSGLALGESKLIVTQTIGTDVKTLNYTINRVAVEAPFRVTSHANNQSYAEGVTTFRGTAASGAAIKAVNQWGTVMGTTTADANGNWVFNRNLGPTTEGYDITFTATKGDKTETQKLHLNYQGVVALQITSPSNNSVYKPGLVTFRGKASPNATIKAVNQWGTLMGTTTSNLDSEWSFSRNLGPTTDGYDITFTATKGTDVQRIVLHLNPEVANVPVSVTSIKDGDTYTPGQNILRGKGTPGATVAAVNALNGWNVPMGTAIVGANGDWALPARNWGPSNDYQIKVTQTNPDKSTSTVTVSIKAPVFTALTVDGFTLGNPNGAGVFATFTGKATPGATVAVKSALTGSTYQTVTTAGDGTWSATRVWDPNHTYTLIFEQKTSDGKTDSVAYGSFTAMKTK